jgi:hypothetical protein
MARQTELTLAEIAVELNLEIDRVVDARSLLPIVPLRRDAAGVAFYDRRALTLFRRLLVENDISALFEPPIPGARHRYLEQQLGRKLEELPLTAEDRAFLELLRRDPDAAEAQLNEEQP